jgi:hypothetical protein
VFVSNCQLRRASKYLVSFHYKENAAPALAAAAAAAAAVIVFF